MSLIWLEVSSPFHSRSVSLTKKYRCPKCANQFNKILFTYETSLDCLCLSCGLRFFEPLEFFDNGLACERPVDGTQPTQGYS